MDVVSVLLQQRSRRIDTIIPDVVITEKHSDTLEITEHPVERPTSQAGGASAGGAGFIADHAYRRPSELTMEIGFSGGGSLLDFTDTSKVGLSLGTSPKEIYQQLLALQQNRLPFDVVTGKRKYSNMLIRTLEVTTDKTSENVLMVTVSLREVIITTTQAAIAADKANMTLGVETAPVVDRGLVPLKPVENPSLLTQLFGKS